MMLLFGLVIAGCNLCQPRFCDTLPVVDNLNIKRIPTESSLQTNPTAFIPLGKAMKERIINDRL